MRIVHVSKVTGISGSEEHLLTLLPGLSQAGVQAHALLLVEPGRPVKDMAARFRDAGVDVTSLTIGFDLDPTLPIRLAKQLRALQPGLVHTHLIHADLHGALAARLAGRLPVVSSRHNDDAFRRHPAMRLLTRLLDGLTTHYVAISKWVRDFTLEVEGIAPDKVTVVHYGLAVPAQDIATNGLRGSLGVPSGAPMVAAVARLVEQKGHTYLLDAFRRVADALPAAHLVLVGDGPLRASLEAQSAALGLSERVLFAGWRPESQEIIANADVLAMPSLWEGFGLVALEAMAVSRPIVATRASALPEVVVDGETGWLVPPRDAAALGDALLHALREPELARKLGQQGRERLAVHFSPERMVAETRAVYERVLARKGNA